MPQPLPLLSWHLQTYVSSQDMCDSVARDWKNYVFRSFTICTSSQILLEQFKSRIMRLVGAGEGGGGGMRADFGGKPAAENLL